MEFRLSREEEIPQLKELWKLAFGDEGAYVENYFQEYHRPERMYVVVEGARVIGMTTVFDSHLQRFGRSYLFGYLYAVATDPSYLKQGIASGLLAFIYEALEKKGYDGVTTVPARPDLHPFFRKNRFEEYFEFQVLPLGEGAFSELEPLSYKEYEEKREALLQEQTQPYITLAEEGFSYQQSVCALGTGGFYWDSGREILLTVEQATEKSVIIKECLSSGVVDCGADCLGLSVAEGRGLAKGGDTYSFGMILWFTPPEDWSLQERGYLGLAFD